VVKRVEYSLNRAYSCAVLLRGVSASPNNRNWWWTEICYRSSDAGYDFGGGFLQEYLIRGTSANS